MTDQLPMAIVAAVALVALVAITALILNQPAEYAMSPQVEHAQPILEETGAEYSQENVVGDLRRRVIRKAGER